MIKKQFRARLIFGVLLAVLLQMLPGAYAVGNDSPAGFRGGGTREDPYLISSEDDLRLFRNLVNGGESFEGRWFLQTADIDLHKSEWKPIGIYGSGRYFQGVYNGGGHVIENLQIKWNYGEVNNTGFFGVLGGMVMNLGIESGVINGNCVGSIASHSMTGKQPVIINCYSRATLNGNRVGGIVDNFGSGLVINCWYDGETGRLNAPETGSIASYDATLLDCYGAEDSMGVSVGGKAWETAKDLTADSQLHARWVICAILMGADVDMLTPFVWNGETLAFADKPFKKPSASFDGDGTKQSPYLIQGYSDLLLLRTLVATGETFENTWFRQTADIVIEEEDWTPIGFYDSGRYFQGVYDGGGHNIDRLTCMDHGLGAWDCTGLFGRLGGVVANLSVTNADIRGEACGIIASASAGYERTMAIINCYAQGAVCANRPAGIADFFDKGLIAGCISDVSLSFLHEDEWSEEELERYQDTSMGGITACSVDTKVYACFTTADQVMPEAYRSATSSILSPDDLQSEAFLRKQNLRIALIQQLFGDEYGVDLIQWTSLQKGGVQFGGSDMIEAVALFNEYAMVLLTAALMLIALCALAFRKREKRSAARPLALAAITGAVAFFVDCAALGTARQALTPGRLIFIAEVNVFFLLALIVALKRGLRRPNAMRVNWGLLAAMAALLILELLQFDTVPRYDASLYYGSLARGSRLFRLDLLTYIGAFVCWKWAQGTALLVAPLEFLLPGRMIGVYISNIVITEITLVVFYRLIREMIPRISRTAALFSGLVLVLCPYQLGMFTYLCFDSHCVYFAVWFIYSYKRRNDLMTAFCGFLLFFTKISGGAFYAVFLIAAAATEVIMDYRGHLHRRIAKWWKWSRCLLWVLPAIAYLLSMRWGEWLTIQHFNGANLVESIAQKELVSLENTLVQSFVYGFRWLFAAIIAVAFIIYLYGPKKPDRAKVLSLRGIPVVVGVALAGTAVLVMLLLYNSDAECPRYTALQNVVFAVLLPVSVCALSCKTGVRNWTMAFLAALLLVQTYWSFDPSIIATCSGIDTGTNCLYRLALDSDVRPGMNIGFDYGRRYGSVGDIYAYNAEYNFYNGLINEAFREIDPDQHDTFYVLDVIDYEMHLCGNQYFIYWDAANKRFTYNGADENSFILRQRSVRTEEITEAASLPLLLDEDFYLIVPARVSAYEAVGALRNGGYQLADEYHPRSLYGAMDVYHFQMREENGTRSA